jgi:hypothetical protein
VNDASGLLGRHAPALKRLVPPAHRAKAWTLFFRALPTSGKTATFARWFRGQAEHCSRNGSPLYATLLSVAAEDIERQGPCWRVVEAHCGNRAVPPAATPLAFMAGVHQVVLERPGNALEPYYPSAGGTADLHAVGAAFLDVVSEHRARLQELLMRPVQTNEVARSRVLIGGFLLVARDTGLPLRILEFGASAGLNLRWDHYRYEIGGSAWGDPDSPVRLVDGFIEGRPPLQLDAVVAKREGSDLNPIDARSAAGQLQLTSHVWADQTTRIEQLRAACAVAADVDVPLEAADALTWVKRVLAEPTPGLATVVYDTCVMEYLSSATRAEIRRTIEDAGSRATADHPLAWLHLGPGEAGAAEELSLTTWPGGTRTLLATCDPYAQSARWHGPTA